VIDITRSDRSDPSLDLLLVALGTQDCAFVVEQKSFADERQSTRAADETIGVPMLVLVRHELGRAET